MRGHVELRSTVSATRRAFLGTAAGMGLGSLGTVIVGGVKAQAQSTRQSDIVHAEIVDQYLAAVRKLQAAPSGEALRQMASGMRLLAAWGSAARIDDRVWSALRDAVRHDGRDRLLSQPFDIAAEVKLRGWQLPPGFGAAATLSDRAEGLNELLRTGVVSQWLQFAKTLDNAGTELDRKSNRPIVLVRQTTDCSGMQAFLLLLETQAFLYCVLLIAIPEMCAITTASYIGWGWYMWWQGC